MTIKQTIIVTIYGSIDRTSEATRQVKNYAESLPGVAVRTDEVKDSQQKKAA